MPTDLAHQDETNKNLYHREHIKPWQVSKESEHILQEISFWERKTQAPSLSQWMWNPSKSKASFRLENPKMSMKPFQAQSCHIYSGIAEFPLIFQIVFGNWETDWTFILTISSGCLTWPCFFHTLWTPIFTSFQTNLFLPCQTFHSHCGNCEVFFQCSNTLGNWPGSILTCPGIWLFTGICEAQEKQYNLRMTMKSFKFPKQHQFKTEQFEEVQDWMSNSANVWRNMRSQNIKAIPSMNVKLLHSPQKL